MSRTSNGLDFFRALPAETLADITEAARLECFAVAPISDFATPAAWAAYLCDIVGNMVDARIGRYKANPAARLASAAIDIVDHEVCAAPGADWRASRPVLRRLEARFPGILDIETREIFASHERAIALAA